VRRGSVVAVVNLTHFRDRVNSPFGATVGDRVIAAAGRRLADGLAPRRVFRSGGGEFTVEVTEGLDRVGATRLAELIVELLAGPFEATGEGLGATVGVCLEPIGDDPFPAWAAAARGADVEAPSRGQRIWIVADALERRSLPPPEALPR
jgi:GGDEF domain-containing protein